MSRKILYFLYFCLINTITSQAQSKTACTPSSCGDLTGITFPFRLKTDPKTCGNSKYELECANNRASVTFKGGKKFNVLAINYANYSIRLIDPNLENNNNCSFPSHTLTYDDFPSQEYNRELEYNVPVTFIICSKKPVTPTTFPLFDNSFCRNGSTFSYVATVEPEERNRPRSPLPESCRVESSTMASIFSPNQDNSSLSGIRRMLEYGFEVSFYRAFCQKCESTYGYCTLDEANNYEVSCKHYCREDVPLSKLIFRCQFEYYVGFGGLFLGMGLGGLVVLRFLIGLPCLMVLIVCMCRKRQLPADETVGMKNAYVASSSGTSAQV